MSVNVPVTTWIPTSGNGEFGPVAVSTLVDLSGNSLVDLSGNTLVDLGTSFMAIPTTTWAEDDSA